MAPFQGQAPPYAYARPANAPPSVTQTTIQGVAGVPGDFQSPSVVRVVTVNDTLARVQDAFTNERRINDEVANSKLLVVDNLITQTAALRIKKIDEIRDLADRFVDELNRMREEDKVTPNSHSSPRESPSSRSSAVLLRLGGTYPLLLLFPL